MFRLTTSMGTIYIISRNVHACSFITGTCSCYCLTYYLFSIVLCLYAGCVRTRLLNLKTPPVNRLFVSCLVLSASSYCPLGLALALAWAGVSFLFRSRLGLVFFWVVSLFRWLFFIINSFICPKKTTDLMPSYKVGVQFR